MIPPYPLGNQSKEGKCNPEKYNIALDGNPSYTQVTYDFNLFLVQSVHVSSTEIKAQVLFVYNAI